MVETDHNQRNCCKFCYWYYIQCDSNETKPHNRTSSFSQCLCRPSRLRLSSNVDTAITKDRFCIKTFYSSGEYCCSDLCTACYSIVVGGGFGSYLLGLSKKTYEQAGVDTDGNIPGSYKEPGIGWMTGFLFIVSFVGLLALVPLRKIMIIDYKLTYPSGTATAVLINGFHTPQGDKMARKQVHGFVKFFTLSFVWAFF
ncbi:putative metal-nicotianamine transporter YSL9 isoform X2 [Tasmannia lanceolata]|uniref:putative metal-nicotianamine transporter YSL9 isoform X2 n=1 Tax=Tasmannia lanceolata TaxID=3420 RepID=UPI004062E3F6